MIPDITSNYPNHLRTEVINLSISLKVELGGFLSQLQTLGVHEIPSENLTRPLHQIHKNKA